MEDKRPEGWVDRLGVRRLWLLVRGAGAQEAGANVRMSGARNGADDERSLNMRRLIVTSADAGATWHVDYQGVNRLEGEGGGHPHYRYALMEARRAEKRTGAKVFDRNYLNGVEKPTPDGEIP